MHVRMIIEIIVNEMRRCLELLEIVDGLDGDFGSMVWASISNSNILYKFNSYGLGKEQYIN